MFIVISFMIIGIFVGFLPNNKVFAKISTIITVLIWLLLFLLGIEVGSNKALIEGLGEIGIDALLITIGAVVGSTLFSWALWRLVHRKAVSQTKNEK